ncbi:PKD-like family lipoprotein [Aestuariibaculum sp. M13]|uniref:PKD-like family lipoprotein n=1 Tax=Aestuariibaculum sp. M13 TaxID=2967132 RepID=UPI002159CABD|nr:PKD-like family lipoprotein [Aestuariibaculum sp. M13]MCR8669016.1 PKD-like family lipoprotein [Aestuariibaculum sp. M13]
MRLNKIKLHFLALTGALTLGVSCMDDEGNYDYKDINEVEINAVSEDYTVERFTNLVINPEVKFSIDVDGAGEYSYRWVAVTDASGKQQATELGTTKNLDAVINLKPGEYIGYYFVTDEKTGIETQYDFNLEVINTTYEGWLVLSDTDQNPRVDMISLYNGEYQPFYDVFAENGLELSGEAKFMNCYTFTRNMTTGEIIYGVYVSTTGNGTTRVDPDTFEWSPEMRVSAEFQSPQPEDLELDALESPVGLSSFALVDNNVYFYNFSMQRAYSSPLNTIAGERFDVSPMMGKGYQTFAALYDTTNKRYVRAYRGAMYTMPASRSTKFNYNDTGMDLVYMTSNDYSGLKGNYVFSILKDPATSKHYLANFNIGNSSQTYYEEITGDEEAPFAQAEHIAINPVYGYIYYNIGSKVYRYDWTKVTPEVRLELDAGSDEITLLKFHDFAGEVNTSYVEMQNHLIVGRHDGIEGTLEFYDVQNLDNPLNLVSSYSGFGKVKSVAYRQR